MSHAFYLSPENWTSNCILDAQEARHLSQALRMKVGENVEIFDGQGRIGQCLIEKISKREVELAIISETLVPRPSSLPIMALAWSKATRRGFFMEKAVELGVHEVWLWTGEHSQGKAPENVKDHWQAQCIAAMKQCKNPWLPQVHILSNVQELIARSANIEQKFLPWEVQDNIPMLSKNVVGQDGETLYVIGPEGGFSNNEIEQLSKNNFKPVSLGNRVLRCETAALLCLGIHWWASHLTGVDVHA